MRIESHGRVGDLARGTALERGVDIATVSERLGHSSVATTAAIYSHAIRGKDRAAALVWDDLMQQARGERPGGVN
jgi:integrase